MPRRLTRSFLISGLAAGAIQILDQGAAFGADLNDFFPIYAPFSGQLVGADGRLISSAARPSLGFFHQYDTSVSHSSNSSFDAGIFNVKTETSFQDTAKTDGNLYGSSFVGNGLEWQKNQVGYSNSQMNIGDTMRVKTRFGASTYDASEEFFYSLSKKKTPEEQRALRFSSLAGPASGAAALTRTEADVLKFGDTSVTLFQQFSQVNSFFEDVRFSDKALRKQTREDVFSTPDRETNTYGVSLAQGSSGVMFSQSSLSDLSGTASSFYREQRFNSKAWLGLRDLANSFSNVPVSNFVPNSLWVGYSEGAAKYNVGGAAITGGIPMLAPVLPVPLTGIGGDGTTADATFRNLDAGLSWQLGGAYATAGVWRSQQLTSLQTSALADGVDVSVGVREKNWTANAYVSLSRWTNQGGASDSGSRGLDGGASFGVLLERLPSVKVSFNISNYDQVYTAWGGRENGQIVSGGVTLDFSKYLTGPTGQKLNLFYFARQGGYSSQWDSALSYSRTLDHVVGTTFRTPL